MGAELEDEYTSGMGVGGIVRSTIHVGKGAGKGR